MPVTSGIYSIGGVSGTMGAGLSAASNIYSFRWTNVANVAAVKRVTFSAGDTSTAFTAGVFTFNMFVARSFTAADSSGTLILPVGNDGKLRTAYQNSLLGDLRISSTGALTAGTRTLDAQPFRSATASDPATAGNTIVLPTDLFYATPNEQPLILSANEGFVIQATVPATGTWVFSVNTEWEEGTGY